MNESLNDLSQIDLIEKIRLLTVALELANKAWAELSNVSPEPNDWLVLAKYSRAPSHTAQSVDQ